MYQSDPPKPAKETLPTMYDLPSEDPEEPGVPDEFHILQPERIPYYFVFNRYTDELQAFRLMINWYQPLSVEGQGIWLEEAELGLGLWQGEYQGISRLWLRWYDRANNWILTPTEAKNAKLRELLRENGIDFPNRS